MVFWLGLTPLIFYVNEAGSQLRTNKSSLMVHHILIKTNTFHDNSNHSSSSIIIGILYLIGIIDRSRDHLKKNIAVTEVDLMYTRLL